MSRKPSSTLLRLAGKLPVIGRLISALIEPREPQRPSEPPSAPAPTPETRPPAPPPTAPGEARHTPPAPRHKAGRHPGKKTTSDARRKPASKPRAGAASTPQGAKAPACPHCRKTMVIKVARSGANAGGDFWGCPAYPQCRGMRAIFAPLPTGRR